MSPMSGNGNNGMAAILLEIHGLHDYYIYNALIALGRMDFAQNHVFPMTLADIHDSCA